MPLDSLFRKKTSAVDEKPSSVYLEGTDPALMDFLKLPISFGMTTTKATWCQAAPILLALGKSPKAVLKGRAAPEGESKPNYSLLDLSAKTYSKVRSSWGVEEFGDVAKPKGSLTLNRKNYTNLPAYGLSGPENVLPDGHLCISDYPLQFEISFPEVWTYTNFKDHVHWCQIVTTSDLDMIRRLPQLSHIWARNPPKIAVWLGTFKVFERRGDRHQVPRDPKAPFGEVKKREYAQLVICHVSNSQNDVASLAHYDSSDTSQFFPAKRLEQLKYSLFQ